jgi:hypothetical protein
MGFHCPLQGQLYLYLEFIEPTLSGLFIKGLFVVLLRAEGRDFPKKCKHIENSLFSK